MGLSASRTTLQFCGCRATKNQATPDENPGETCFSHELGRSFSTKHSLTAVFKCCQAPEGMEPHQRPLDCPKGYICLFESYFTECGLWLPLWEFLTSYCCRRNIAFLQLSVASIPNAVGIVILAAQERLVVHFDLFEEVTSFSIGVRIPGMVCASSRWGFKIFYGATSRVSDFKKRYFFVKLSDVSVEDTKLSCVNMWNLNPCSS